MPWRINEEQSMVTSAPTISSFTTSSALCTPPVAARFAFDAAEQDANPGQRQP